LDDDGLERRLVRTLRHVDVKVILGILRQVAVHRLARIGMRRRTYDEARHGDQVSFSCRGVPGREAPNACTFGSRKLRGLSDKLSGLRLERIEGGERET